MTVSTESLTKKSGHLAWCAMVALQLAKHDGQVNSESQENLFLTRWLATALKGVSLDIENYCTFRLLFSLLIKIVGSGAVRLNWPRAPKFIEKQGGCAGNLDFSATSVGADVT